jgi:hypothetical protein
MAINDKKPSSASSRAKSQAATKGRTPSVERVASPLSIDGIRSGTLSHISVKIIMFSLIIIFAVGFLITSFNPTAGLKTGPNGSSPARFTSTETIAQVGNDSIERGKFETIAARQDQMMEQFGQKVGPLEYLSSRERYLSQMTDNLALIQAAKDAGITVSDDDIKAKIGEEIKKQVESEQKQAGEANFRRQVEAQYGSLDAYRAELLKDMETNRDGIEKQLLTDKLEKQFKDKNKVTPEDYIRSVTKLKLYQILIRPKMAGLADKAAAEKNKTEAKTKAQVVADALKKNPTPQFFVATAKKESDDFATKSKGGDLGWKLPAELTLVPAIRDAVVKSSGKIVGPLTDETSGDQYIFLVAARAVKLPKDYAKKKAQLLKDFETAQDNEAWEKYKQDVGKGAKVEVSDPALQAYKIQTEQIYSAPPAEQDKLRQDAVQKYEAALANAGGIEAAAIRYQLAQLYRDLKQPQKSVEALQKANEDVKDVPALQVEYARALRDSGDKKTALSELQMTSSYLDTAPPAPPSMFGGNPTDALRYQISSEFESLGHKDLAAKERAKVKPAGGPGMSGMGMPGGGSITIPSRH